MYRDLVVVSNCFKPIPRALTGITSLHLNCTIQSISSAESLDLLRSLWLSLGSLLQGVRKGNIPVEADNHTLILNWNNDTLPLLRQMAVSRQERDSYLG